MLAWRLSLLLLLAWPALPLQNSALPRGGDLGREWLAEEWSTSKVLAKGKWVREGDSARFRVFYTDAKGRPATWTVEILSIEGNSVRMRVRIPFGNQTRTYAASGVIQSDGRTIRGKAEWCKTSLSCGFRVVADWKPVAQGVADVARATPAPPPTSVMRDGIRANPGKVWRVIDLTTPGFHWQGTWTFDGPSVRFSYQDKNSGAKAEGMLELQRWDGAYVRLFNRGASDTYEGYVQPDGKTLKGTAKSCGADPRCRWEAVIEK